MNHNSSDYNHWIPGPQFPQIPQFIPGPQGPPGPPGPKVDTTQLRGIQVQLQGQTATIEDGSPVVFDTLISPQSSFISGAR